METARLCQRSAKRWRLSRSKPVLHLLGVQGSSLCLIRMLSRLSLALHAPIHPAMASELFLPAASVYRVPFVAAFIVDLYAYHSYTFRDFLSLALYAPYRQALLLNLRKAMRWGRLCNRSLRSSRCRRQEGDSDSIP